jgi:replicative DNA helicase
MIEIIILKYILNNNIYNKYINNILIQNKELVKLFYCIKNLHETEAKDYSVDDLELKFFGDYPYLKDVEKEAYQVIFDKLRKVDTDPVRVEEYLEKLREASLAQQIAQLSLEVTEGRKDFQDILDHVSKVDIHKPITEEFEFVSTRLSEIYQNQVKTRGLRWRMKCLNMSLGSLRKGDFGFVFARPETGKTTFLASEVMYMLEQSDQPVLWINNEEQGGKVMLRCMQSFFGYTTPQLTSDIEGNGKRFYKYTDGKFKLFDQAIIHKNEIERLCEQIKPSLILIDQIDKIRGFEQDRNDLMLGSLYQWARELAKQYAPVIAVCQADGQGEGVRWLDMGHVANAKTSKQAEADWILGIGKSNDEGMEYIRYLNISKNKLVGDDDTMPDRRHGRMEVLIRPDIARYEDI